MDDTVVIDRSSDLTSVSFQSDPRSLENCGASERDATCSTEVVNRINCIMQMEQETLFSESLKQKTQTSGKVNLRKSLAWDSAFFTSEGILDPEELPVVNKKPTNEKQGLSIIQEDLKKSFESSTTLDTDNWTTDVLDTEIFGNIRDSIQKSCSYSSKASSSKDCNSKSRSAKPTKRATINCESSPRTMKIPPLTSRKPGTRKQGPDDISTRSIQASIVSSVNGCKSLTTTRVASKVANSNGKSSISTPYLNNKKAKAFPPSGNCHPALSTKAVVSIERNGVIPKSPLPPAPPSSVPSRLRLTKTHPTASRVLYSKSGVTTTDRVIEISKGTQRKRVDSRTDGEYFSSSLVKSPLLVSKNRHGSRSFANHQGYLKSTPKLSSISPNSSMESAVSMSPTSSTSTRTINYSTESSGFSSFSCVWSSSESSSHYPSGLQKLKFNALPHMSQEGCSVKALYSAQPQAFSGASILEASPTSSTTESKSYSKSNSGTRAFKPSGLRLPSPKIGYFDAEKSLLGHSNKDSLVRLQSNPKTNTKSENVAATIIKSRSSSTTSLATVESLSSLNAIAPVPVVLTSSPSPKASGIRLHLKNSINNASNCEGLNSKHYGKDESAHTEVLKVDEPPLNSTIEHLMNQLPRQTVEVRENFQPNFDSHTQLPQKSSLFGRNLSKVQSPPLVSRQTDLAKSSFSDVSKYGKENLINVEGARRSLETEAKFEVTKVVETKQLEKRISSLKLSLSNSTAMESSVKVKTLLNALESSGETDD